MTDDTIQTYVELLALNARFARLIDHFDGDGVAELFTENGCYSFGDQYVADGREAIRAFYDARKARGPRVSRHVFSPLSLVEASDNHVRAQTVLTLFAADGDGVHPAVVHLVADYDDVFVQVEGHWMYKSRTVAIAFGDSPFSERDSATT